MEQAREGSPYNACSTLLSMDCQIMDQQSASKPASTHASMQQANLNRASTSCVSSNINDDHEKEEEMEENAHNGMLQGSMIFDMLSAMQFNSQTTINTIHEHANNNSFLNIITPSSQKPNPSSNMSPDGISSPWHLNLYNNTARAIDTPNYQGHMDTSYLSSKDTIQQSAPPSGFDPIASFLKLPVLADQTKLGLADQRLINSYSSYIGNNKEDHYGTQGYSASNNNWFSSLQLESIRDCSNVNNENNMEDEGHVVQYLDHNNMEGASEEAKLLMKLNGEQATMSSHDTIGSHEERVLNESYNSSSMHMLSSYHNGEQLLYTLNEGGDVEGGQGSGLLDNMHMMNMMVYNNDPRGNVEFGVIKAGPCSSVMGGNVKTTRKRGVRGSGKNSEERENQRMTHIAVERNRRRQMNEHLRVLRALMPPSYIQRGDQASIIGGAIEFVRELEQLLQCLESQKRRRMMVNNPGHVMPQPALQQAAAFVNTAQEAAVALYNNAAAPSTTSDHHLHHQLQAAPICMQLDDVGGLQNIQEEVAQAKSAVADIEVKVVEKSEALIKILSQRRPRQLLYTIQALQDHLHLSILHTNVTTIDNTVLYSFTVKIHNDHDCSANHIATLVHGIFIDIMNQTPIKDVYLAHNERGE